MTTRLDILKADVERRERELQNSRIAVAQEEDRLRREEEANLYSVWEVAKNGMANRLVFAAPRKATYEVQKANVDRLILNQGRNSPWEFVILPHRFTVVDTEGDDTVVRKGTS